MSDDQYANATRERLLEDVARLTAEREAALALADERLDALQQSRHEYGVAFDARTAERDAARNDARAYQLDRDVAMGGVKGLRAEVERLTAERDLARSREYGPCDQMRLAEALADIARLEAERDAARATLAAARSLIGIPDRDLFLAVASAVRDRCDQLAGGHEYHRDICEPMAAEWGAFCDIEAIVDSVVKGAPSTIGRRAAIAEAEIRGATWQRDAVAMHRGEGQPDPTDVCREARAAAVDPYPDEADQ